MSSSYLIAFVTIGTLALFGLLAWILSSRHPDITRNPAMVRRTRRVAVLLPVLGLFMGYGAFAINDRVTVVTLFEVMAEGSAGLAAGTPAPIRRLSFDVQHPGVEHELLVAPTSETLQTPVSAVDVSISLHGPAGEPLIAERTERFKITNRLRSKTDWEGKTFNFTPRAAGSHTLRVIPLTAGIPAIHVRVADPAKRDGKRMAGY